MLTHLCRPYGATNIPVSRPHRFTVGYVVPSLRDFELRAKPNRVRSNTKFVAARKESQD